MDQQRLVLHRFPRAATFGQARGDWLVATLAFALLVVVQLTGSHGDAEGFADAGSRLLHGHLDIFQTSWLQLGPVDVALIGIGAVIASAMGAPPWMGGAIATSAVSALLLVSCTRAFVADRPHTGRGAFAGLAVVFGGAIAVPASYGHPEEALAALLICAAVARARKGGVASPALLLSAAIAVKLWAVVALGLLLVSVTWRRALLRAAMSGAAVVLAYLPFVAAGRIATFDYVWRVQVPAPVSLLMTDGSAFGYRQRVLQVVIAALVGIVVAWRLRSGRVVFAFPVAVMAARLLLDPLPSPYYWSALLLVTLLLVFHLDRPLLECVLIAFVADVVGLLVVTTAQGSLGAVALAGLAVAALSFATRSGWRSLRAPNPTARDGYLGVQAAVRKRTIRL